MQYRARAIARLIAAAVMFINLILGYKGISPIPFNEAEVSEWLTVGLTGAAFVWAWWKNNCITCKAISTQIELERDKKDLKALEGGTNE